MSENTTPRPPAFERGNEHLDRLLSDPQISADVAQAHAEAEEMDRIYAMNLAQMTQVEVARKLGVGQGGNIPAGKPRRHAAVHSLRLPDRHRR